MRELKSQIRRVGHPPSQSTYVDTTDNFMRWLRYEFEPGSRVAPYTVKKGKKDATA